MTFWRNIIAQALTRQGTFGKMFACSQAQKEQTKNYFSVFKFENYRYFSSILLSIYKMESSHHIYLINVPHGMKRVGK